MVVGSISRPSRPLDLVFRLVRVLPLPQPRATGGQCHARYLRCIQDFLAVPSAVMDCLRRKWMKRYTAIAATVKRAYAVRRGGVVRLPAVSEIIHNSRDRTHFKLEDISSSSWLHGYNSWLAARWLSASCSLALSWPALSWPVVLTKGAIIYYLFYFQCLAVSGCSHAVTITVT